jgi:uncharacterized protein YndB with AHSA1/START domain
MKNANPVSSEQVLTIVREFNAPRNLVFKAFSEAERLGQWWGPVGFKTTVVSFDFKPQGLFHYKMESPELVMWAHWVFGQIKRPELIEFTLSFTDEHGKEITRAPFFNGTWPLEIFNEFSFSEKDGKTILTVRCYPINATEKEIETYLENQSSFRGGTNATLDKLEQLIPRLMQAGSY